MCHFLLEYTFAIVHSHAVAALMLFLNAEKISLVKSLEGIDMAASFIAISSHVIPPPPIPKLCKHNEHLNLCSFALPSNYLIEFLFLPVS